MVTSRRGPRMPVLGRGRVGLAAALLAPLALTVAAQAQQGQRMALDSTTEAYRQQAVEGHRQHDFSPRTPPRTGRFIYGHWTPYDPPDPATLPPSAKTHVIARGDTLWDIAARYYQDPLLWPYVWEANSWITWPHWIYPGDVLVIPPLMLAPDGQLTQTVAFTDVRKGFYPAGTWDDIHCGHFVVSPNRRFTGEIVGMENDPPSVTMSLGDVAYINVGARDGLLPGDELAIIYPDADFETSVAERELARKQLRHPLTDETLGIVMRMAGRLRIILLGEAVSTARIVYACDAIEIGYDLQPFTEVPIPLVRRHDVEKYFNELPKRGRGFVAYVQDRVLVAGTGQLLTIDLGRSHGVLPGDLFRVYRDFPFDYTHENTDFLGSAWDFREGRKRMKQRRDPSETNFFGRERRLHDLPPHVFAEIVVLYTEHDTATAKIIYSDTEIMPGDRIVYMPIEGFDRVATFVASPEVQPGVPVTRQPFGIEGEEDGKDSHPAEDPSLRRRR